jgi:hypothetical protein
MQLIRHIPIILLFLTASYFCGLAFGVVFTGKLNLPFKCDKYTIFNSCVINGMFVNSAIIIVLACIFSPSNTFKDWTEESIILLKFILFLFVGLVSSLGFGISLEVLFPALWPFTYDSNYFVKCFLVGFVILLGLGGICWSGKILLDLYDEKEDTKKEII